MIIIFFQLQLEMSEDIGNGFNLLAKEFTALTSLHLTFRRMPFTQMIDISEFCPNLQVLRLIGFGIDDSFNLKPNVRNFNALRVLDIRMVKGEDYLLDDMGDNEDIMNNEEEGNAVNTVSAQLLNFILHYSRNIEDVTISAVAGFMNESFLLGMLEINHMTNLQRLCISISPCDGLTASVARNVVHYLPNLHTIALSRWNMTTREIRNLRDEFKRQNLYINVA
jgi:hypothetical protein